MINDTKYLHQMLDTACGLIDSLESLHIHINGNDYMHSDLCRDVEAFFNDVKELSEDAGSRSMSADEEAQDYNTFGNNKI